MPELPEVAAYAAVLRRHALRRTVREVEVRAPRMLEGATDRDLRRALRGRKLGKVVRIGKWALLGPARGPFLALHFGMTGSPLPLRRGEAPTRHTRLLLRFADGTGLAIDDPRMFGRFALASDPDAFAAERGLGPDALDATPAQARRLLHRSGGVKATLLDQSVLSGVGNLYADEILWRARIAPRRKLPSLTATEGRRLLRDLKAVLRTAVAKGADYGSYPKGWLIPHRDGGLCPRCRGAMRKGTVAGRATVWCPRCQG